MQRKERLRAKTCGQMTGEIYGPNLRIRKKNTLQRFPSKRKALSILNLRRPPMRSRFTRRSLLLAALALPFTARSAPKIVFLSSELQPLVLAAGDNRYQVGA